MYDVLEVSRHVINYSNDKNYGISNLKLQKLLYFIQAEFLTLKNNPRKCFGEKIEAWDFGPVVPEAYNEFKQYGGNNIPPVYSYFIIPKDNIWGIKKVEYKDDTISCEDKQIIDGVVDLFSEYSAVDLVDLTHRQSPWREAYSPRLNNEISIESIRRYFQ